MEQREGNIVARERTQTREAGSFDHHDHSSIVHGHQHVHITHCVVDGDYGRVEHRSSVHLHEHNHSQTEHAHQPHDASAGYEHDYEAHIHDHAHPSES
jgi:hypothetical protein